MISFCKWSRERSDMGSIKVLFGAVTRERTLFNEATAGSNNVYCQTSARMLISIAKRTVLFALEETAPTIYWSHVNYYCKNQTKIKPWKHNRKEIWMYLQT